MHSVKPRDEVVHPARPTVFQMDYTFSSDSLDTSQELKVMGMITKATGFARETDVPVKGRKEKHVFLSKRSCSEVCAADRP